MIRPVTTEEQGHVVSMDTRALGLAVVELGGGRSRSEDTIDPAVGLEDVISIGESSARPLATIHARDESSWQQAAETLKKATHFSTLKQEPTPLIHEIIR